VHCRRADTHPGLGMGRLRGWLPIEDDGELEFGRKLSASLKAAMPAAPAPLWLSASPR